MPIVLRRVLLAAALSVTGLGLPAAFAQDQEAVTVTVNANMARILRINAPAATVIIGNPAVADVTIQDPQTLILTGRSYGRTNMIILDANGDPIADTVVEVAQLKSDTVTIFSGAQRTSVACAPNCQPVIMLGDDTSYTSNVIASSTLVDGAAAN
ncbi:pilus assembly protein N-terminal domain-containing protein [Pelagibacterium sp. 26DY04]|uniref:pilus assembly protein N-terminal domain-containing protein n=1 Tax=Pelagibacterium sp. 26DY04 TaxID=2967130 RepID=UPI00281499B4|nr:pilus assembly protein N-terminal domain-containing protein [Pelagibacterium sp. 26DY04]WMT87422.1 pilus assembly protein N-terminal domain-containing protein [Pelagibacterium sp. 26DY04]